MNNLKISKVKDIFPRIFIKIADNKDFILDKYLKFFLKSFEPFLKGRKT